MAAVVRRNPVFCFRQRSFIPKQILLLNSIIYCRYYTAEVHKSRKLSPLFSCSNIWQGGGENRNGRALKCSGNNNVVQGKLCISSLYLPSLPLPPSRTPKLTITRAKFSENLSNLLTIEAMFFRCQSWS